MFILEILKWALIIILWILLIAVILAAYLLILPVFYNIKINFDDRSFEIHSKDLLRLYNIGILRENKTITISLKALFGIIDLSPKEKKAKHSKPAPNAERMVESEESKESAYDNKDETNDKSEQRKENLKKLLKDKETYKALQYAIFETFKTLKKLFPKEFYAEIDFCLGKPDLTGLMTGGLSLLPFIYQNNSKVIPDFLSEKAYIKGFLKIKGYFALVNFIVLITKLMLNKQIRRVLQTLL